MELIRRVATVNPLDYEWLFEISYPDLSEGRWEYLSDEMTHGRSCPLTLELPPVYRSELVDYGDFLSLEDIKTLYSDKLSSWMITSKYQCRYHGRYTAHEFIEYLRVVGFNRGKTFWAFPVPEYVSISDDKIPDIFRGSLGIPEHLIAYFRSFYVNEASSEYVDTVIAFLKEEYSN